MKMSTQTQTKTETFVLQARTPPAAEPSAEEPTIQQESAAEEPRPKWQYPKIISAGFSFFVAGVNDGSFGALLPYVIRSYSIDTNMVAIL